MKRFLTILMTVLLLCTSVITTRIVFAEDEDDNSADSPFDTQEVSEDSEEEQEEPFEEETDESEPTESESDSDILAELEDEEQDSEEELLEQQDSDEEQEIYSGVCGENVTWELDLQNEVLTISGTGSMYDYEIGGAPWDSYHNDFRKIIIEDGVSRIGAFAFYSIQYLLSVTIPDSVVAIGNSAFESCRNLETLTLPDSLISIGDYVFEDCYSLTQIIIPDSVTEIGKSVFNGCERLFHLYVSEGNQVYDSRDNCNAIINTSTNELLYGSNNTKIPDSVTAIGDHAFYYRDYLYTIEIPDSVTTIGNYAFYFCDNLLRIDIPDSVTTIGRDVFGLCKSLEKVTLSKSLTEIEEFMFSRCTSLKSITIPDSVTSIKGYAFSTCSSLSSIELPKNLQTILSYAFDSCSSLETIVLPESLTYIGQWAFDGCKNLNTIYYCGTQEQFYDIYHYPLMWPEGGYVIVYNYVEIPRLSIHVPNGKYCIHVQDLSGNPIQGADVRWETYDVVYEEKTDSDGNAFFWIMSINEPQISVAYDGYLTWTNENTNWKKNKQHFDIVTLYPDSYSPMMLANAKYWPSGADYYVTDILRGTKKIPLSSSWGIGTGDFYIQCNAIKTDNISNYQILQNDNVIKSSQNGRFSLNVDDGFVEGANCSIRTISNDGTYVDTHINLEFVKNEKNKSYRAVFDGKKITLRIKDDVPYLGGDTITFSLPIDVPITYDVSNEKLQIGINANLYEHKEDDDGTAFENWKKEFNSAIDLVKNVGDDKKFKKFLKQSNKAEVFNPKPKEFGNSLKEKTTVDFIGYAEADLGSSIAKGRIYLRIKIELFEFSYNTLLYVPVTIQVKGEAGVEAGGEIAYDWANAKVLGGVNINPNFKLTAFGGVGLDKAAGLGAYGSANVVGELRILDVDSNNGWNSVTLEGELGIKYYVGLWSNEIPFAYNKWYLYTRNSTNSANVVNSSDSESLSESLYDPSNLKIDNISYLKSESEWMTDSLALNRISADGIQNADNITAAENQYQVLLSETYRNAQPVMVSDGTNLYAAFVKADPNTQERYIAIAKYSVSSWSDPIKIEDDSLLDANPSLCITNSGDLLLAYSKTADGFDNRSLISYAESQMISVGKIDKTSLNFTEISSFKNDDYVCLPKLANVGDNTYLLWLSSVVENEGDVLSTPSASIHYAAYNGSSFAEGPSHFADTHIESTDIGIINNQTVIAFSAGGNIYGWTIATDSVSTLKEDAGGLISFGKLPNSDSVSVIYASDSGLFDIDGNEIPAEGMSDEYVILGDDVYYSKANESGANLSVIKYDRSSDSWSLPVSLNGEEGYLENLSVCSSENGIYAMGMNTKPVITENSISDHKDLVFLEVAPVSDLLLKYVDYDADALSADEDVPVTLYVTNGSDHVVNSVDVEINGQYAKTVPVSLLPSETMELELSEVISCPSELTEYSLHVFETGKTDDHPDDNVYSVKIGYCDLALSVSYQQTEDRKYLIAFIENKGVEATSGKALLYDIDGTEKGWFDFGELEAGDSTVIMMELPEKYKGSNGGNITVSVSADKEESYLENNIFNYFVIDSSEKIYITSLILDKGYLLLTESQAFELHATITPENATVQNLVWSSSDESVVSIYEDGVIVAESEGEAVITVSTTDGSGFSASCTVKVVSQENAAKLKLGDALSRYDNFDKNEYTGDNLVILELIADKARAAFEDDSTDSYDLDYFRQLLEYAMDHSDIADLLKINLNYHEYELTVGDYFYLYGDDLADFIDLYYRCDNENILKLFGYGYIEALNIGTATVRVYIRGLEEIYEECVVRVVEGYHYGPNIDSYMIVFDDRNNYRLRFMCYDYYYLDRIEVTVRTYDDSMVGYYVLKDGLNGYYTTLQHIDRSYDELIFDAVAYDFYGNASSKISITLTEDSRVSDACNDLQYELDGYYYTYTGSAIKPSVRVYEGITPLTAGVDYTVSYSNNVNVPSDSNKLPTITITGKGNYKNKETIEFDIDPKYISDNDVAISVSSSVEKAEPQYPKPVVKWGKKTLKLNKDYTVEYTDSYSDKTAYKDPGVYSVTVIGKGNYSGRKTCYFEIYSKDRTNISKASVIKPTDISYTGMSFTPDVVLKDPKTKQQLVNGVDYNLTYSDNTVDIGTVTITITGIGTYYGNKTTSFKIKGTSLSKIKLNGFKSSLNYNEGLPVLQEDLVLVLTNKDKSEYVLKGINKQAYDSLYYDERRNYDYTYEYIDNILPGKATLILTGINAYTGTLKKTYTITGIALSKAKVNGLVSSFTYDGSAKTQDRLVLTYQKDKKSETVTLEEGRDYDLSYTNNINRGTATLVLTGKGLYTGTVKKTYRIDPYDLSTDTDHKVSVDYSDTVTYSKAGAKPEVSVYYGDTKLTEGTDYTLTYKNNTSVNDGSNPKKIPSFTVKGKGNFKGSLINNEFSITQRSLEDSISMSAQDKVYSLKKNGWKSSPVLTDNGKKLVSGTDYDKNDVVYTYVSETSINNGSVTRQAGDIVEAADIIPAGTQIRVTVTGIKNYKDSLSCIYRITKADISKASITVQSKEYTGKPVTLTKDDITIKLNKQVVDPSNYEIDDASYKNNIRKGKASVTIVGVNDLGSRKTINFTIGPKSFLWWWRNLWQ